MQRGLARPKTKSSSITTLQKGKKNRNERDGVHIRQGMLPVADRTYTTLRWWGSGVINNPGINYASIRYRPTYTYDVDPVIGSTAVPFFAELALLYRQYRVLGSKIRVNFSNYDQQPTSVAVCPVNVDPGINALPGAYFSSMTAKTGQVGSIQGNSREYLEVEWRTDNFAGSKWNNASDPYTGGPGAIAPVNFWYWSIHAYNPSTLTNGLYFNVTMDMDICFFEQTTPTN